jgi:lysophospholipase L1-like esterase
VKIVSLGRKAATVRRCVATSPVRVLVLVGMTVVIASSACGSTDGIPVAARSSSVAVPKVGVDLDIPLTAWWSVAGVVRSGDEVFTARLNPADRAARYGPRYMQMTGLGWPYVGSEGGHAYAGPEVDHQWELQNNEYEVAFRFTGTRLGLVVLSSGGQWRARVDGVAVGGSAPRSAGSSYAYHVLDLDFSRSGPARSRTITFQLSGGAWLSGIGTGAGSDRVSAPASRAATPSVYWLGDSYVAGGGARHPGFDDLVHVASQQAGLRNVTIDALGGTGYLKTNPVAKFPAYLTRAKKNLRPGRARPDLIIVAGSINDGIYSTQQVRSAASRLFAYLARAVPKAKVVVVPFTDGYPIGTPVQHSIDGVLAAARSAPNVLGVLNLPAQVMAQRGNTSVATLGSRLFSTTVKYHPSPAGHKLFGEIIGRFIAKLLVQRRSAGS